jgi:hypothetical protein
MDATLAKLAQQAQENALSFLPNNELLRQNLLQSAQNLVAALETPAERCQKLYPAVMVYSTTRLLVDTKVYRTLAEAKDPITASQLAKSTNTDPALIERLLKFVAVENHVQETGPNEYLPNDTTRMLASFEGEGMVKDLYLLNDMASIMPKYFKERNYTNPTKQDESAWFWRHQMHYFEYLNSPGNEEWLEAFKGSMRFKTLLDKRWFDEEAIVAGVFGNGVSKDEVLMIDVGGADGSDLANFRKAHPDISGRLILQDLPQLVNSLDASSLKAKGVEAMDHDMFSEQPIKGAKAYFAKMVLHDWPKADCQRVLSRLGDAMTPGYSRILLTEIVVADVGAGKYATSLDILMMTVHAAQERRESEWRELVEEVEGLKIRKIWPITGAAESVIEIERVE